MDDRCFFCWIIRIKQSISCSTTHHIMLAANTMTITQYRCSTATYASRSVLVTKNRQHIAKIILLTSRVRWVVVCSVIFMAKIIAAMSQHADASVRSNANSIEKNYCIFRVYIVKSVISTRPSALSVRYFCLRKKTHDVLSQMSEKIAMRTEMIYTSGAVLSDKREKYGCANIGTRCSCQKNIRIAAG